MPQDEGYYPWPSMMKRPSKPTTLEQDLAELEQMAQWQMKNGDKKIALLLRQIKQAVKLGKGKQVKNLYNKLGEAGQAHIGRNIANEIFGASDPFRAKFEWAKKGSKIQLAGETWSVRAALGTVEAPGATNDLNSPPVGMIVERGAYKTDDYEAMTLVYDPPKKVVLVYPWASTKTDGGGRPKQKPKSKVPINKVVLGLFGRSKKLTKHKGRQVSGDLPDKGQARQAAKSKGADTIREGLVLKKSGLGTYWGYCWIGYKGDSPIGAVIQDYQDLMGGANKISWSPVKSPNEVEPLGKPVKAEVTASQVRRETIAALLVQGNARLANAVAYGPSLFTKAARTPQAREIDELVKLFARKKALDKPGVANKLRLRVWKEFQRVYDKLASQYSEFDMASRTFWNDLEKRAAKVHVQATPAAVQAGDGTVGHR